MLIKKQEPKNAQKFSVVLIRREDGQFYAGRTEGHEMARESSDSLGTPIGGKGSIYPLLGNFAAGQIAQLHDEAGAFEADLGGLPVVIEVPREVLRALNQEPDRRLLLEFEGVMTSLNLEEGTLQGSSWVKPTSEFVVSTPGVGLVDRTRLADARAEALKGAEERRASARALASQALAARPSRVAK